MERAVMLCPEKHPGNLGSSVPHLGLIRMGPVGSAFDLGAEAGDAMTEDKRGVLSSSLLPAALVSVCNATLACRWRTERGLAGWGLKGKTKRVSLLAQFRETVLEITVLIHGC